MTKKRKRLEDELSDHLRHLLGTMHEFRPEHFSLRTPADALKALETIEVQAALVARRQRALEDAARAAASQPRHPRAANRRH